MKKINLIAILATGMFSSFAFAADNNPTREEGSAFEYHCKFESSDCDDRSHESKNLECWVEGKVCKEDFDDLTLSRRKCDKDDNSIKIKCSNGFDLHDKETASAIEDKTLWINGEEKHSIATLRIKDFLESIKKREKKFSLDSDLLISEKYHNCHRLKGECHFKKKDCE